MQQQVPWLAADRYEVGEVVGRGGYGMVCRGLDRKTGQAVALKMLSPEAGRDPDLVERMLREQQALVALSGTCAVTAIDLCRLENGAPCLVMEWLEGCDLEQQLTIWETAGQRGTIKQLVSMLRPLTQTLERAHQIGILHRDIKPANIFLCRGAAPGVRLLDFGLSRMQSGRPLTENGMVMGSPSYIAPETWRGDPTALDGRADWFALAVIVFRWLTGRLPFDAPDMIGKMKAVTSGPRPSVVAVRADLPRAVDAWVSRALAIDPAERFQTGGDFREAFEAALRGEPWASSETSGVRVTAGAAVTRESPDRKSALAAAWGAAAALLKRFTNPREAAGAKGKAAPVPPPLPSVLVGGSDEDAPASDRKSVWLDSTELEELAPTDWPPAESPPSYAPVADSELIPPSVGTTQKDKPKGKGKRKGKHKSDAKAKSSVKHAGSKKPKRKRKRKA
jgi:eukaryotic-like serine/threonine-protein kinase